MEDLNMEKKVWKGFVRTTGMSLKQIRELMDMGYTVIISGKKP
jgi:hypothetical protein